MVTMDLSFVSALFADVYHFSVGISGLAYIGLGLGFIAAAIFGAKISDQMYLRVRT